MWRKIRDRDYSDTLIKSSSGEKKNQNSDINFLDLFTLHYHKSKNQDPAIGLNKFIQKQKYKDEEK